MQLNLTLESLKGWQDSGLVFESGSGHVTCKIDLNRNYPRAAGQFDLGLLEDFSFKKLIQYIL